MFHVKSCLCFKVNTGTAHLISGWNQSKFNKNLWMDISFLLCRHLYVCMYVCRFTCGFCRKQAQPKGAVIRVVTFEFENRSGTLGISTSCHESGDGNVRCLGKKRSIKQTWLLISLPSRCYRWDMETHSDLWTDRENMLNHISSSCGAEEPGASSFPEWISTTMTRLLAFELAVKNQF